MIALVRCHGEVRTKSVSGRCRRMPSMVGDLMVGGVSLFSFPFFFSSSSFFLPFCFVERDADTDRTKIGKSLRFSD